MYVYALETCSVEWQGRKLRITRGVPWRSDDPFVKAKPEMFSRKPPVVGATVDAPVEQMTKAPGEKRRVRHG